MPDASGSPVDKDDVKLVAAATELESPFPEKPHKGRPPFCVVAAATLAIVATVVATGVIAGALLRARDAASPSWVTSPYRFDPYLIFNDSGLDALHSPSSMSADGRILSQQMEYAHPNGVQYVTLEYTATLTNDYIIALDYDPGILNIQCHNNTLEIIFRSAQLAAQTAANVDASTLVAGSHNWNCSRSVLTGEADLGERPSSLLLSVTMLQRIDGERLFLGIAPARHDDFFESLNLTFRTNMVPSVANNYVQPSGRGGGRALARRELWGFIGHAFHAIGHAISSVAKAVWHGVSTVAHDVVNVVKGVATVVKTLVTGQYNTDHTFDVASLNWNYGKNLLSSSKLTFDGIDCDGSYAHMGLTVEFELSIDQWSLDTAKLIATADAAFKASAAFQQGNGIEMDKTFPLTSFSIGSIDFSIGPVPVHIQGDVDLDLGVKLTAQEGVDASVWISANTSASYGIQYQDGHWSNPAQHQWSHDGHYPTLNPLSSVGLTVSLTPSITFMIDYIGGPTVGVTPYLELGVDLNDASSTTNSPTCDGLSIMMNWGVEVKLGAKIDIHLLGHTLYQHTWGPSLIYQLKKPIGSGCLRGKSHSLSLLSPASNAPPPPPPPPPGGIITPLPATSAGWVLGTVWSGNITTPVGCSSHTAADMSIQYVGKLSSNTLAFVGARNYRGSATSSTSYSCVTRSALTATFSRSTSGVMLSLEADEATSVAYSNCSSPSAHALIEEFGSA